MRGGITPTFDVGASFQSVSFSYGKKPVIINASFPVRAGKVTTVTGPSGVGKTTLADLLLGLHRPTAGEVFIDDVPLAKIDLLRWRNMTGYVPQEVMLFHDTVAVNVSLGEPEFTRDDVEQALQQAGCWDFVSQLPEGMDTIVGERGSGLSGGQRQRIALARALIHKPKLLILDEATSALDPLTEATIVRNICELSRQTGLTVLSISHQPIWVANADIVLEIEEGHVLEKPSARAIAAE
jgi:ATP-binding cassette subfamily C protein